MATVPGRLIGVGSSLMDLVLPVSEDFLAQHVPGAKGGMEWTSAEAIAAITGAVKKPPVQAAGGAASNTTVGVAALGNPAAFIGAIGDDALGAAYQDALRAVGCDPRLEIRPGQPSGQVLSLVTPDAQRTLRAALGAAATLEASAFTVSTFADARLVYLEGYALFNHDLTRSIAAAARAAGAGLAFDLASFEVVKANKAVIAEILGAGVEVVFANEDEAAAWCDGGPEAALADLAKYARVAVVKLGKEGALVARGAERLKISAQVVEAVDTTGAGDLFAAGFLAAYLRGLPLEACAGLGAQCGAAVVQVMGAQLDAATWTRLRGWLEAWA